MADRGTCVIIGSGLGGLSAGAILSRAGYRVTVLEKEPVIGGCLQCFTRRGAMFETGMHFIGSADPGQTLHRLLTFAGVDVMPQLQRLDRDGYNVISLCGQRFPFANGEAFVDTLGSYFPSNKDDIARYYRLVKDVARASALHSLDRADGDMAMITRYQLEPVDAVLDSLTSCEELKGVLAGDLTLYAGQKGRTPFALHAFITDFYNESAFRVVGGSSHIAAAFAGVIEANGGRIVTCAEVASVKTDGVRATSVETVDGRSFEAGYVVSDIHPSVLVGMIDGNMLRPAYRKRISGLRNTPSCFTVYLKFRPGMVEYMNHNFFGYTRPTPWGCEDYTLSGWPGGYLYMHHAHAFEPRDAVSGQAISYMDYSEVSQWEGTRVGRRGDGYRDFCRNRAERLIDVMERDMPGLRESIEEYYTSTPLTYACYTATPGGSMYGVAKDVLLGSANRVSHRTRIPNLFLVGQNTNSHGMLGVMVGSVLACGEMPGYEDILYRIKCGRT